MLNDPAKFILSLTSLAPVLVALFMNHLDLGEPWNGIHYLIIAFLLFIVCWLLLDKHAAKEIEIEPLHIREYDRRDLEMLTFLLIYLLPFIQSDDPMFEVPTVIQTKKSVKLRQVFSLKFHRCQIL